MPSAEVTIIGSIPPASGSVTNDHVAASAAIARSKLAQNDESIYGVEVTDCRVWNDFAAVLPGTAASDDLAVIEGTLGTDFPTIQTSDLKNTSGTQYLAFTFTLPPEYNAGETVKVRVRGGMITTVASASADVDVECYKNDGDGAAASDLCATAAQSINNLTKANKDFVITSTSLAAGDQLIVRVGIAIVDSATATAVIGEISKLAMLLDIRG